eukprot:6274133-Pyramimonas_sp.AAC.1
MPFSARLPSTTSLDQSQRDLNREAAPTLLRTVACLPLFWATPTLCALLLTIRFSIASRPTSSAAPRCAMFLAM